MRLFCGLGKLKSRGPSLGVNKTTIKNAYIHVFLEFLLYLFDRTKKN